MRRGQLAVVGVLAALVGCTGDEAELAIDVRTDLLAGAEFTAIEVVTTGKGVNERSVVPAFEDEPWREGARAAEVRGLEPAEYQVVVRLLDSDRQVEVERTTIVSVRGSTIATVVLTRDCRGVDCSMEAEASSCLGGRCGDPRCTPESPEFCSAECATDGECPTLSECSTPHCEEGLCLYRADSTRCGSLERCDVELGCLARPDACDATLLACGDECIDPLLDERHCGACDRACAAGDSCEMGTCMIECVAPLMRCGDTCAASCETTFDGPVTATYGVPAGCDELLVRAWGAGGGNGVGGVPTPAAGGFVQALVPVTPGEMLTIIAGGAGSPGMGGTGGAGGSPGGGGNGGGGGRGGGGGGGFAGVFRGDPSQATALAIAGGGGGSGAAASTAGPAGAGGGAEGQDVAAGMGGTQTAGGIGPTGGGGLISNGGAGSALQGGNGGTRSDGGGGGGGGWFGGGGAPGAGSNGSGGGGGSGFVTGTLVVNQQGNRALPGNDGDPLRGTFGGPREPGRVVVRCF